MPPCIYSRCKKEVPVGSSFCPWCGRKQTRQTRKKHRRANGSGSVYKVSGQRRKPWIALKDGHSIGQYFATEKEAIEALAALEEVKDVELFNLTFEGVYDRWGQTAYKGCTPSFSNDYENAWKHIPPRLRSMKFREVKSADVQAVIDDLHSKGKSKSVQAKVKSLYSFLCSFGMSNDIINKNYSQFLKLHATERRRDSTTFTEEEVYKVWRKADEEPASTKVLTARMIMIYLFTGMRLSELLPLECATVYLDEEYPYLVGGEKTEAGRNRIVPIISTIKPYVQFFYDHATGPQLFSYYMGNKSPKHWRDREYYPLLDELGIERHTPHGTRRTNATLAVQSMVDPAALQKIGGWKEFQTIQKYYNKPNLKYLHEQFGKLDSTLDAIAQEHSGTNLAPSKNADRKSDRD